MELTTQISTEDDSSEDSEVDWSWLEEVEYLRASESFATAGEQEGNNRASPTKVNVERRRADDRPDSTRSVAMSVTATAKSVVVGGSQWPPFNGVLLYDHHNNNNNNNNRNNIIYHCRCPNGNNNLTTGNDSNNDDVDNDEDEVVRCNDNNETVDREHRDCAPATTTTGSMSSWMRASMRRLRHLRVPEGTQHSATVGVVDHESAERRTVAVSAPNSLPDIALIAPEILAAQTNGTSGTLLRPSSAPVRNVNAAAAAAVNATGVPTSRRTGRQFVAGRSRVPRNRETPSRQGSLASITTASDITVSGTTICSSSFGGASTSPPSSTATTPQRATSRRTGYDIL